MHKTNKQNKKHVIQFAQNVKSQEYDVMALNNGEYRAHDHLKFKETHSKLLHVIIEHMYSLVHYSIFQML